MRGTIRRFPNLGSLPSCETRKWNSQPTPTMATRVALDLISSSERRSDKGRLSLGANANRPRYLHRKVSLTLAHDAASGFKNRLPKQALSKPLIPTLGSRRKPICEQNNRSTIKIVVLSRQVKQKKIGKTQIVPKWANLADFKLRVCRYAKGRRQGETPSILANQLAENARFPSNRQQVQSGKPNSASRSS
jgi:hypothetical protein